MHTITLDFETHYDSKTYTLSKMDTMEYVLDTRYETILCGVKVDDQPTVVLPENHIREWAKSVDWATATVVAHNMRFDGSILAARYGINPGTLVCTMSLAVGLGLDRLAGGASLAKLAEWLKTKGLVSSEKGTEVVQADGKRARDFTGAELATYAAYCRKDVDICYALYQFMRPHTTDAEIVWQSTALKAYTQPQLQLETEVLIADLARVEERRQQQLTALCEQFGTTDVSGVAMLLQSNPKFAELLTTLGVDPPTKTSDKTGKETYAFAKTDQGMLDLLEHDDPMVRAAVEVRLGVKSSIERTRLEKLIAVAGRTKDRWWPVPYKIAHTQTGRLSGDENQNPQNFPSGRVKGQSKAMRKSVMAPLESECIVADSAQVEARILAYVAGQEDLLDVFRRGGCPYSEMAATIYRGDAAAIKQAAKRVGEPTEQPGDKALKLQRQVGKAAVLGCGYGLGANKYITYAKVSAGVTVSEDEAQQVITTYRQKNHHIAAFWKVCDRVLKSLIAGHTVRFGGPNNDLFLADGGRTVGGDPMPGIQLPDGVWLNYPGIRFETRERDGQQQQAIVYNQRKGRNLVRKYIYGGLLTENLVQALAFAVLKWQALRVEDATGHRLAMNVHDEHVFVVPEDRVVLVKPIITHVMSTPPPWLPNCPINAEASSHFSYGLCK